MIRNKIATRNWKPSWPAGTFLLIHSPKYGWIKTCISRRSYRWPTYRRLSRHDYRWAQ